jgi:hypothetical protein
VAGRSVASGHTTRRTIAGQIPVWWTCAAARGLDRGQLASAGPRWQPFQLLGLDCVVGDDHACARSRQIGPLPTAKRLLGPFPCSFSTRRLGPCDDKGNGLRWPCLHHSSAGRRTLCARVTVRPLRRHVAMLRFRGWARRDRPADRDASRRTIY